MTHDATELFECAAEAFRAATGYPAIGKDAGPEYGGEAWQKERERLWMVFRAGYQRSLLDGRDALSAAQRENETMREALVAIKQLCPYNLEIEYDTRHSGEPTAHVLMLYDEEDGYVLDREKVVSMIDAALSGQGGA